jgi:hypothetical protein
MRLDGVWLRLFNEERGWIRKGGDKNSSRVNDYSEGLTSDKPSVQVCWHAYVCGRHGVSILETIAPCLFYKQTDVT